MGEVNEMSAATPGRLRLLRWPLLLVLAAIVAPSPVWAQEAGHTNIVVDITKAVLLDPTTYAPAALSYTSQRMDWKTSQTLFNAGWVEHNSRFTVSGRPDDTPISYAAGNNQIRRDALVHLQESVVNNLSAQILDRALAQKYPNHRTLLRTLSWVERVSFSSYVGYLASADHFKQVQRNLNMARDYGIN
jgi:hypothetical protein